MTQKSRFEIGEFVQVKIDVWQNKLLKQITSNRRPPNGPIIWISPAGDRRILIRGCGWQFKQEEVELISIDIDISEFE